jgi:lysozyme family protein
MNAFERAWQFIQVVEGGATITNDPDDRGGMTRYGISQAAYPFEDIRNLTEDRAKHLYQRDYWAKAWCDKFPAQVGIALFDSAVNQGVSAAVRLLQESLRVEADGIVGPATLAAANRRPPNEIVNEFLSRRAVRYADGQAKYRRGWFRRLFLLKDALSAV